MQGRLTRCFCSLSHKKQLTAMRRWLLPLLLINQPSILAVTRGKTFNGQSDVTIWLHREFAKAYVIGPRLYWFLRRTIMTAWKLFCELFLCWIRSRKFSGQGGWVMTEGQQAAGVSLFLCAEGRAWSGSHDEPRALSPPGCGDMRKRCRGMGQTVLLITSKLQAFPLTLLPLCIHVWSSS